MIEDLINKIEDAAECAIQAVGGDWHYRGEACSKGAWVVSGEDYLTRGYDGEWESHAAFFTSVANPNNVLKLIQRIKELENELGLPS